MLKESIIQCQYLGGALYIAPEHRLSLHLKWHDLKDISTNEIVAEVAQLHDLRYYNIME